MQVTQTTYGELHPNTKRALSWSMKNDDRVFLVRNKEGRLLGAALVEHVEYYSRERELLVTFSSSTNSTVQEMLIPKIRQELNYLKRKVRFHVEY